MHVIFHCILLGIMVTLAQSTVSVWGAFPTFRWSGVRSMQPGDKQHFFSIPWLAKSTSPLKSSVLIIFMLPDFLLFFLFFIWGGGKERDVAPILIFIFHFFFFYSSTSTPFPFSTASFCIFFFFGLLFAHLFWAQINRAVMKIFHPALALVSNFDSAAISF